MQTFLSTHENVSKRQAEIKINELAVKEKRETDKYIIWHIRPEFEKYLHMTSSEAIAAAANAAPSSQQTVVSAASSSASSSTGAGAAATSSQSSTVAGGSANAKKRKTEEVEEAETTTGGAGGEVKEPRRYKRAFGFFVKAKRAEAESQLGESASVRGGI